MTDAETIADLRGRLNETERILLDFYAAAMQLATTEARDGMIDATQGLANWWNAHTSGTSWKEANCRVRIRIAELAIARATEARNEAARNLREITK